MGIPNRPKSANIVWRTSVIATLLTSVSVTAVMAQTSGPNFMDEIIVTSQKREQSLQDVPLAVSAYGGDVLENSFIGNVTDLALISPSLSFTQSTNQLQSSLRIRGIGTTVFSQTVEPSVSFVVDGVVIARQGQALTDLVDVERVEVLRGPQGTLFGKNASAGVINIVSKRPADEFEATLSGLIAEDDEYETKISMSGPINDRLGVRATGFYKNREGHIDNIFDGRNLNGNESYGGRVLLAYEPTDTMDITLIVDVSETLANCCQFVARDVLSAGLSASILPVVASPRNDQANVNADVQGDSQQWGWSAELNKDFGDVTMTSITAYRNWDFQNNLDVDQTPFAPGTPGLSFDINGNTQENTQWSQELRFASPVGSRFEWVAGAYFFYLDIDTLFEREIFATTGGGFVIPVQFLDNNNTTQTENYSGFADVTWNVDDRLDLFGGVRLIYEEVRFSTERDNFIGGAPVVIDIDRETDDIGVAGRAGAAYALNNDLNVYASYARSYKGRAFDENGGAVSQAVLLATDVVEAETGNSFEAGIKATFFDGRLSVNAAGFYTRYSNFQALAPDPDEDFSSVTLNVGTVRTAGAEIEFQAQPFDALTLFGGFAYTDAQITDFPSGPCFTVSPGVFGGFGSLGCQDGDGDLVANDFANLAGGDLPNSPDFKINFTGRYQPVIPNLSFSPFFQGSVVWQDEVQYSLTNNPATVQDAYALVDLSAGLVFENVTATFFVKNVFDQFYTSNIFANAVNDPGGTAQFVQKNAERYVGGTLQVRF